MQQKNAERIKVAVRCRPLSQKEKDKGFQRYTNPINPF